MNYEHSNDLIHGLSRELIVSQQDRVDELNDRIGMRNLSEAPLKPNFDPRPVQTKYSRFPMIDRRTEPTIDIREMDTYKVESNFAPITRKYPVSSYLAYFDTETMLRNQSVALQHGAEQGVYVPGSNSELYKVSVPVSRKEEQIHPLLFHREQPVTVIPDILKTSNIGKMPLYNHTRNQLRDI